MPEIVVLSGKGGTGKTSITAAFACLARDAVIADCDVDAADLHLILGGETLRTVPFVSGEEAHIDASRCTGCGLCRARCRFDAIVLDDDGSVAIDPLACEGCAVCQLVCPARAVVMTPRTIGDWRVSDTRVGPLIHARLTPGGENSGKLVTQVRHEAAAVAERSRRSLRLIDGPPGIGCPVIGSCTGVDAVVLVTEPTVAGAHDLERVQELVRRFGARCYVVVNKWDLDPDTATTIETRARTRGAIPLGRIRYDRAFTAAQIAGEAITETITATTPAADEVRAVWSALCQEEHLDAPCT